MENTGVTPQSGGTRGDEAAPGATARKTKVEKYNFICLQKPNQTLLSFLVITDIGEHDLGVCFLGHRSKSWPHLPGYTAQRCNQGDKASS